MSRSQTWLIVFPNICLVEQYLPQYSAITTAPATSFSTFDLHVKPSRGTVATTILDTGHISYKYEVATTCS